MHTAPGLCPSSLSPTRWPRSVRAVCPQLRRGGDEVPWRAVGGAGGERRRDRRGVGTASQQPGKRLQETQVSSQVEKFLNTGLRFTIHTGIHWPACKCAMVHHLTVLNHLFLLSLRLVENQNHSFCGYSDILNHRLVNNNNNRRNGSF